MTHPGLFENSQISAALFFPLVSWPVCSAVINAKMPYHG